MMLTINIFVKKKIVKLLFNPKKDSIFKNVTFPTLYALHFKPKTDYILKNVICSLLSLKRMCANMRNRLALFRQSVS